MRVAILMYAFLPKIGGTQFAAHGLATGLVRLGHSVTMFADEGAVRECQRRRWEFEYELRGVGRNTFRLPRRLGRLGEAVASGRMEARLRIEGVQVVQVVGLWPWASLIPSLMRRSNRPLFVRAGGEDIQTEESLGYGFRRDRWVDSRVTSALGVVTGAIAISDTIAADYLRAGVKRARITVIPPGIDCQAFRTVIPNRRETRRSWGLPEDCTLLLGVGRIHPKKGFPDLIRALSILNREQKKFAVAVVGKGSDQLRQSAAEMGVQDAFFAVPEIGVEDRTRIGSLPAEGILQLYGASDYVVVPSYLEGHSNVPLQAMAAGVPVVVTDAPGCRETVKHLEDGVIVNAKSPGQIADAIRLLEADRGLRLKLIDAGLRRARELDWTVVAARHLELYSSVLAGKRHT